MTELQFSDPYQLAKYIKEANKQTPVKSISMEILVTSKQMASNCLVTAPSISWLVTVKSG